MKTEADLYNELSYYTLGHADPSFIHQHVVDAYIAQKADADTKPMSLIFALIGLYLYIEKGYSGKQIQHAHMLLSEKHVEWPATALPETRGTVSVKDVMDEPPGIKRDSMIRAWCESVWEAYTQAHMKIRELSDALLIAR